MSQSRGDSEAARDVPVDSCQGHEHGPPIMLDIRPVGYIVGWLVLALGVLMLAPFGLDIIDGDPNAGAFGISAVLTILVGAAMALACADGWRIDLSQRQGFLMTAVSWASFILVSTLPLMLGDPHLSFVDALFESTSALTATGGSVIAGLADLPRGALLWRGMLCWLGGIGIVLMAVILLPVLNVGGMQVLRSGDFNTLGKIMPRAKEIALSCGAVYLVLTAACTLGYLAGGLDGFDALVHAMSTVATAGMGNYDSSFVHFGPMVQWVAVVFMLLGGMSFVRFVQFARGEPRALFADSQIRAFLAIYLVLCLGLLAARALAGAAPGEATVREVMFNMASVLTTTGFASADYALWGPLSDVLFFIAMMICACSGSTTGGPKVFRYQLLYAATVAEIRRLYSPNAVISIRYQGEPVSEEVIGSVAAFFMLYFLTLGVGAVALVLIGVDPMTAISGAAACLGNVGPGLGPEIGPYGNFAGMPEPAIVVFTALMFVGRLELMAVFVLFTPVFWRA